MGSYNYLRKRILLLAWPVILEMALHMIVWVFDTAMVGRLSEEALNAVGLGGQVVFTVTFIFSAIGAGAMAIVARYTGAQQMGRAEKVASQAVGLGFLIGICIASLLFFSSELLLGYFVKDAEVQRLGITYMKITSVATVFMVPLNVSSSIMRGIGNTRTPMIIAAITNGINIIGDYVLIFGHFGFPRLEVTGAALATAGGQIIGSLIIIGLLLSGVTGVKVNPGCMFRLERNEIRRMFKLSIPAALEEFTHSGSRVVSSLWIASMGKVAFAANQVAVAAESISFMPGYGFAVAASTLVGQQLGAGNKEEAEASAIQSSVLSVLLMSVVGLIFFLLPTVLISIFTDIPGVMEWGAKCLRVGALEQPFIALSMVMAGALRGAGDTRGPFMVGAISNWFVRLPLIYLVVFVFRLNVTFIWVATLIQFIIESGLMSFRFARSGWKDIDLETI